MSPITMAERAEIREMARELARRELTPRAAALDAGGEDALHECWRLLVDLGLDRALLDEQKGGAGLGVTDLLATIEELAVGDGGVAMSVLLCNAALATLPTDRRSTGSPIGQQLAGVPAGARWTLVPAASGTELTISDGALHGRIACALGAHGADGLVILALDEPAPVAWGLDTGAGGCEIERDLAQMGLRAAPAASVELTGVACAPAPDGSDDPNKAMSAASALALLRAGTAAIAHGIARRAHEMALEYAHARQQGGVAIIEHDAVSDMLSAMAVRLACWPQVTADPDGLAVEEAQALAVKIAATDAAVASTTDAVQVFGGTGYMVETGIEKLMRDAKYCQIFPEPNWVAQDELMRLQRAGRGAARTSAT
jgi:alkylation response protein AidB-like acyl-CoA dehydrogenase